MTDSNMLLTLIAVIVSVGGLIYQRASYNRDKIHDAEKTGALLQKVENMKEELEKTTAIEIRLASLSENLVKLAENVKALTAQVAEIKCDIKDLKNG